MIAQLNQVYPKLDGVSRGEKGDRLGIAGQIIQQLRQFGPRYVSLVRFSIKIQEIKGGLRIVDNKIKEAIAPTFTLFEVGIANAQLANTLPIRDQVAFFGGLKQIMNGFIDVGVYIWEALFQSLNALFEGDSKVNFIARQEFVPNWGQRELVLPQLASEGGVLIWLRFHPLSHHQQRPGVYPDPQSGRRHPF